MEITQTKTKPVKSHKCGFNLRRLRLSLKFRPEVMKLILKMRQKIRKKSQLLHTVRKQLKEQVSSDTLCASTQTETNQHTVKEHNYTVGTICHNACTQTENVNEQSNLPVTPETNKDVENSENSNVESTEGAKVASDKNSWNLNSENGENEKSIAEQVAEAARDAMKQSGMVYVESAGMYYDYKTGYYYSADLGLYYHPDTGCYYHYSEDKKTFEFHSYPDQSKSTSNARYEAHEKRKARKLRKGKQDEGSKPKRRKKSSKKKIENGEEKVESKSSDAIEIADEQEKLVDDEIKDENGDENEEKPPELEDGECSESGDEGAVESDDSDASMSTVSDTDGKWLLCYEGNEPFLMEFDSVAKHHPPSMRVIVRETNLPKLKVGSLFLVTKDGGTVGREGGAHAILIEDTNISRNHLEIKYDFTRNIYTVTDLGSKNGTTLNGVRISESQVISQPVEVMHGSTIQVGETKLLCHIHPGVDTCGHCEPGLVMETQEKEKKAAYTRTCSVQKQHQLELARLKNKYAPKPPPAIEETAYNDRAKERRDKVGSSHHSEKTQSSDLDTFIAPENKGFKLLEKMGWSRGEGLGKDNQGDVEPVPLVSNEGKSGLGTTGSLATPPLVPKFAPKNTLGPSTLRLASMTKMLRPPAKAFQGQDSEDESE